MGYDLVHSQRVVLVTGGSKGIGKAICKVFIGEGDHVIVNHCKPIDAIEKLREEFSSPQGSFSIEKADVTDYAQIKQMVDNIVKKHGKIDVLINNAGIIKDGYIMLMSAKDWNDVINVNLTGVFHCTKAVSEHMIGQRSGTIINIASLSGITGLPGQTNYSAAKGGVIAFTMALSKELAPFCIRVNTVAPGVIETDIIDSLDKNKRNSYKEHIPLKRFGKPEEVASVVRFLASSEASYITGELIRVSGGLH